MAMMSGLIGVQTERQTTPRHAPVFKWTMRSGWGLALGFSIAVWSIVAALVYLA